MNLNISRERTKKCSKLMLFHCLRVVIDSTHHMKYYPFILYYFSFESSQKNIKQKQQHDDVTVYKIANYPRV